MISGDLKVKLVMLAALAGAGLYLGYKMKKGISGLTALVPEVVKDGAQAMGQLGKLGAAIVTDPLDAFGIRPATTTSGAPAWEPTVPWANQVPSGYHDPVYDYPILSSEDPVSNNSSGINFNLF
ncbi:hypothetical protein [Lacisediminimonas profundi]|uniref:hypothetical protein n=1 Tax=Lacisediminimonas profundi TaxID=2603856 RepID=UPI00124B09D8|nr:hypothetical protein [Lacisediminimonas profundi]